MQDKPKRLYRLYIDESGDHSYGKKETFVSTVVFGEEEVEIPFDDYVELEDDRKRYLSLTGCMIEAAFYEKTFCAEKMVLAGFFTMRAPWVLSD
jgi:hypothetical protein